QELKAANRLNLQGALRVENVIIMAKAYLSHGQTDLALRAIETVPDEDLSRNLQLFVRFRRVQGLVRLRRNQPAAARDAFLSAIEAAEAGFKENRGERDRAIWQGETGLIYRELVRLILDQDHDPEKALALWEKYRSVPVRQTGTITPDAQFVQRF